MTEEPAPVPAAKAAFNPALLTQEDIRAFVNKAIVGESWRPYKINKPPVDRPVRIYADGPCSISYTRTIPDLVSLTGVYDLFHFG